MFPIMTSSFNPPTPLISLLPISSNSFILLLVIEAWSSETILLLYSSKKNSPYEKLSLLKLIFPLKFISTSFISTISFLFRSIYNLVILF